MEQLAHRSLIGDATIQQDGDLPGVLGDQTDPTEAKIKGVDYDWLRWALKESQRRKAVNILRRGALRLWRRYGSPHKVARKLRQWLG